MRIRPELPAAPAPELWPFSEAPPPPPPPEPLRLDDETFDVIASIIAQRCPVAASAEASDYLGKRGLYDAAADACAALPSDRAGRARLVDAIIADVGADAWMLSGLAYDDGGIAFPDNRLVAFWRDDYRRFAVRLVAQGGYRIFILSCHSNHRRGDRLSVVQGACITQC